MNPHDEWNAGNAASRAALRALVGRLSEADLARDLGEGWTVAGMLGHLGFYDARVLAMLRRWKAGQPVADSPLDPDIINAAKLPFFQLLPGHATAELMLALAAECDAAIAALKPDELARMEAAGYPARLDRAHHRREHIEQIERALAA